jgi:hypothetical protein
MSSRTIKNNREAKAPSGGCGFRRRRKEFLATKGTWNTKEKQFFFVSFVFFVDICRTPSIRCKSLRRLDGVAVGGEERYLSHKGHKGHKRKTPFSLRLLCSLAQPARAGFVAIFLWIEQGAYLA